MTYKIMQSDCRTGWYVADASGRKVSYGIYRRREHAVTELNELISKEGNK